MRSLLIRYGLALAAAALALAPRFVVGPPATAASLLLLLAAVLLASRYAGLGPALFAALLGPVAGLPWHAHLTTTSYSPVVTGIQVAVFVAVALSVSWTLRRSRLQLDSHAGLLSAMSSDPDAGMLTFDRLDRLTSMNPAAERMLGWSHEELVGRNALALLAGATGGGAGIGVWVTEGSHAQVGEDCFVRKDGSDFPVSCSTAPVVVNGRVNGRLVIFRDDSERRRAEAALRSSEERYRHLVNTLPHGILLIDRHGYIVMANQSAAEAYGWEQCGDLIGMHLADLVVPEDAPRATRHRHAVQEGAVMGELEYAARRRDGSSFPIDLLMAPIDEPPDTDQLIVTVRDLTSRKRAEEEQQRAEERKSTQQAVAASLGASTTTAETVAGLLEAVGTGHGWTVGAFWQVNSDASALICRTMWHADPAATAAFEELTYRLSIRPGDGMIGRVWQDREPVWIENLRADPTFARALVAAKVNLGSAVAVPITQQGIVTGVIELLGPGTRDLDPDFVQMLRTIGVQLSHFLERKEAERALEYQATHDALTDLPNRSLLHLRLRRALQTAHLAQASLALLLLDLDRFKEVNDTFGHQRGDRLLQEVARRLMGVLRDSDTVARLGGDEFAVLLPQTDEEGARTVAETVLSALSQPVLIDERRLSIWASIGIALYPDHAENADLLMQRADVAMYIAKRAKSGHAVYAADQDEHSAGRLEIIAELRQAIDGGDLVLHYQPKMRLSSGEIEGVEALVRWPHPQRGLVPPDEFVPLAEQTGLIGPLTRWVLRTALRQHRLWREGGLDLDVAVNISAQNLHDPTLVDTIQAILAAEDVPATCLQLEITESAIMVDSAQSLATLQRLQQMGISIAIDDFGTGYSSLAYLKRLPVHEIKIDRSFVLDMGGNDQDTFIAKSVIDLGHSLGLTIVAEGVQTPEIWSQLSTLRCDVAQGFYIAHPLPAGELADWVRTDQGIRERADNADTA